MKQSRAMSLAEAVANVVVGYGLAVATQLAVFPWFGLRADVSDAIAIGAIFTVVSIVRSYSLRRLFEMVWDPRQKARRDRFLTPARTSSIKPREPDRFQ